MPRRLPLPHRGLRRGRLDSAAASRSCSHCLLTFSISLPHCLCFSHSGRLTVLHTHQPTPASGPLHRLAPAGLCCSPLAPSVRQVLSPSGSAPTHPSATLSFLLFPSQPLVLTVIFVQVYFSSVSQARLDDDLCLQGLACRSLARGRGWMGFSND